jgi:hypothetical protein
VSARRLLLVLALAGAAPAAAQQATESRLEGRLDPATARLVSQLVDSAVISGLPSSPLVNKALEGASKGAAPERIVVAVRTLAADLRAARAALGPTASEAELVAGVGALRAGAEGDVLSRVKRARGESSALLPLAVLTDLVAQGIPVDRAASVILGLAERRAADAQYRNLPRAHGRGGASAVGPASTADPRPGLGNSSNPPGRGTAPDVPAAEVPATGRPVEPPATGRPADPTRSPPVEKGRPAAPPAKGRPAQP